jgi:hypothetical protein
VRTCPGGTQPSTKCWEMIQKEMPVPQAQGTIETFGSESRGDFSSTSNHLSSLRDGRRLKQATQHFVLGYFHRVPCPESLSGLAALISSDLRPL